jgi:beta-glucosidase
MATAEPLVPFGFGLSYSNFSFSSGKLSSTTVTRTALFNATVTVKGVGPAGACVVQVYFSQQLSSRVRFDKMLLGFTKVAVPADGSVTATVQLKASDFEMYDKAVGDYIVEAGVYDIYIAQSSADAHPEHLTVTVTV